MVNAQEWLEQKYPKSKRNTITKLNISEQDLANALDLSNFVNLKNLWKTTT
jgi:hypothetical protein